jgi:DNA adenine methylase
MFQPVIKWSGSKRTQAEELAKLFPKFKKYYEPFLGGGSILYTLKGNVNPAVGGDICKPLIELWMLIQKDPIKLIKSYEKNWARLQKEGYQVYYEIRDRFNKNQNPEDLFFLSRTCVNGLIRFNKNGEFNNSLHHTRKGIHPDRAKKIILDWSEVIQGITFLNADYRETTKTATSNDFVYLDPPYFNTRGRYFGTINYEEFISFLEDLNNRNVKFILSYDGMRGNSVYLKDLPKHLYKRHILLESGNSSFRKVMDKKCELVKESVYLNF